MNFDFEERDGEEQEQIYEYNKSKPLGELSNRKKIY